MLLNEANQDGGIHHEEVPCGARHLSREDGDLDAPDERFVIGQ